MKNHIYKVQTSVILSFLILTSCNTGVENQSKSDPTSFKLEGISRLDDTPGMDMDKLAAIPPKMQEFIDDNKISGAVTLVARDGKIALFEANGVQDLETGAPMTKNTIFRIASMTKPFSAASVMMLVEEGKVSLDDPIKNYLPEFSDSWVVDRTSENEMVLKRPSRPVTLRDVLCHTSGLAQVPGTARVQSIRENTLVSSQLPLAYEPGSKWRYGGEGNHVAARIVEDITGMSYTDFLTKNIFEPLGMKHTFFEFPDEHSDKEATIYTPGENGKLIAMQGSSNDSYFRPNGGLLSTAMDQAIWMQAMLDGGIYKNRRILKEESVKEMTRIQTGDLECGFTAGMSFGLSFGIVNEPQGVTGMLSHGTFGHGGAFGTQYWADPHTRTIYILMIQRKGFGNGDDSDIRKAFQEIAAAAIVD